MWTILKDHWKSFLPGIFAFGLGSLFLAYPLLAALLVSGSLFAFAIFYSGVVYRIHETQKHATGPGFQGSVDPSFRNVTVRMYRSSPFFREVN